MEEITSGEDSSSSVEQVSVSTVQTVKLNISLMSTLTGDVLVASLHKLSHDLSLSTRSWRVSTSLLWMVFLGRLADICPGTKGGVPKDLPSSWLPPIPDIARLVKSTKRPKPAQTDEQDSNPDLLEENQSVYGTTDGDSSFHLHIVHDCAYALGTCRCVVLGCLRRFRRPFKRVDGRVRFGNERYATALVEYCVVGERRRLHYLHLGQPDFPSRVLLLRAFDLCSVRGDERHAEVGQAAVHDSSENYQEGLCVDQAGEGGSESSSPDAAGSSQRGSAHRENRETVEKQMRLSQYLVNMFKKLIPVPLSNIVLMREFTIQPRLKLVNRTNRVFNEIIASMEREIHSLSLNDLIDWIEAPTATPKFKAVNSVETYYGSTDANISLVIDLLLFQYGSVEAARDFMETVIEVIDRRLPKRNTLLIQGPTNSGKSLFVDALASLCISVGTLRTLNKRSGSFPTQDCIDKRVIVWEEPNYDPKEYGEFLKQLLGGGNINSAVKYARDCSVCRTPVLITTNQYGSCLELEDCSSPLAPCIVFSFVPVCHQPSRHHPCVAKVGSYCRS